MSRHDPILRQIDRDTVERVAQILGPHSAAQCSLDASLQYENPAWWQDVENNAIVVMDFPGRVEGSEEQ
jgi:hypothetical protein